MITEVSSLDEVVELVKDGICYSEYDYDDDINIVICYAIYNYVKKEIDTLKGDECIDIQKMCRSLGSNQPIMKYCEGWDITLKEVSFDIFDKLKSRISVDISKREHCSILWIIKCILNTIRIDKLTAIVLKSLNGNKQTSEFTILND